MSLPPLFLCLTLIKMTGSTGLRTGPNMGPVGVFAQAVTHLVSHRTVLHPDRTPTSLLLINFRFFIRLFILREREKEAEREREERNPKQAPRRQPTARRGARTHGRSHHDLGRD